MITLSGSAMLIICFLAAIWMIQMLKTTRETRIINSMTLKVLLEYCQQKGVDIDIKAIQKQVETNV